jgi:hypothetical protein
LDSGGHKVCFRSGLCRSFSPNKAVTDCLFRRMSFSRDSLPVFCWFLVHASFMDAPSTFTDFRKGKVVHVGGDQLNLNINFPRMLPAPHPIATTFFYSWREALHGVYSYLLFKVFRRCDSLVGLSKHSAFCCILADHSTGSWSSCCLRKHTLLCHRRIC